MYNSFSIINQCRTSFFFFFCSIIQKSTKKYGLWIHVPKSINSKNISVIKVVTMNGNKLNQFNWLTIITWFYNYEYIQKLLEISLGQRRVNSFK